MSNTPETIEFKTEVRDCSDGKTSYGAAFIQSAAGGWLIIGYTNNYRTYPRAVRARDAATRICRKYARKHFPLSTFTISDD
jgi:hypothetical protein